MFEFDESAVTVRCRVVRCRRFYTHAWLMVVIVQRDSRDSEFASLTPFRLQSLSSSGVVSVADCRRYYGRTVPTVLLPRLRRVLQSVLVSYNYFTGCWRWCWAIRILVGVTTRHQYLENRPA